MTRAEAGKIKIESKTVQEVPSCYLVRRNSRNLKPLRLLIHLMLKGLWVNMEVAKTTLFWKRKSLIN